MDTKPIAPSPMNRGSSGPGLMIAFLKIVWKMVYIYGFMVVGGLIGWYATDSYWKWRMSRMVCTLDANGDTTVGY